MLKLLMSLFRKYVIGRKEKFNLNEKEKKEVAKFIVDLAEALAPDTVKVSMV